MAASVILTMQLGCTNKTATGPATSPSAPEKVNKLGGIGAQLPSVARLEPSTDLDQFGKMYLADAIGGRPPKRLEDMPDLQRDLPKVYRAIESGDYVVNWGADPSRAPGGTARTVLAYVKDAPQKGGVAVFLDGGVRNATAEEIKGGRPGK
jgi:hypothetical protein